MIDQRWQEARRILVVRLDNLGDILLTTPAIHAVKESLPQAEITLFASPVGAQVGGLDPDIHDVIAYQAPWMDPWCKLPQNSPREYFMIETLRGRRFDGAIIFTSYHQSALPAAYMCYLADIPLRLAASIDGPGSLLTTRYRHHERMMHEVERNLDLVSAIGLTTNKHELVLHVPNEAREAIYDLLSAHAINPQRLLVVVHPGCSMPARTYPWEMYAQVIDLLVEQLGATVVVTGAEDERGLVEQVIGRVREANRKMTLPLVGALPFPELCALIETADLTITNNTGPMHISAAVKTPVIALFALTNPPEQWGPWHVPHRQLYHDVPCRICYSRVCPYEHECLRLVTPDMVLEAASALVEETMPGAIYTIPANVEEVVR